MAYTTSKCLLFYELHFSHTISIYLVTLQEGKNSQLLSVSKRQCSLSRLMLLTLFMFMFPLIILTKLCRYFNVGLQGHKIIYDILLLRIIIIYHSHAVHRGFDKTRYIDLVLCA